MSKENKTQKKTKYKWNEIPVELSVYFITRFIGVLVALFLFIYFLVSTKIYSVGGLLILIILLYLCHLGYLFYATLYGKIYVYEGICESISLPEMSVKAPLIQKKITTVYGNSELCMLVGDKKFIVPIYHAFKGGEGSTVRVYTMSNGIYEQTDNSYLINNPILVKVSKL